MEDRELPRRGRLQRASFEDAAGREVIHIQAQKDYTELVKHDQSSTVRNNRSASVTANDSMTVGGNQSFTVTGEQSHTIAKAQSNDIGENRKSTIAHNDTIDAGNVIMGTVGPGVGYIYRDDQTIFFTNGLALRPHLARRHLARLKRDITISAGACSSSRARS